MTPKNTTRTVSIILPLLILSLFSGGVSAADPTPPINGTISEVDITKPVTPNSPTTVTVHTNNTITTVIKTDSSDFTTTLSTTDDTKFETVNNQIRYLTIDITDSTHTATVKTNNADPGDRGSITTWVNTANKSKSPSVATYNFTIGKQQTKIPTDYITDGSTTTTDLRNAIDDWRTENITTNTLRDVISNWRNSK